MSTHGTDQDESCNGSSELTQRMLQAGNLNRLDQAREQSFATGAALGLWRAELAEVAAREKLTRLLGLPEAHGGLELAQRLAELPSKIDDLPDVNLAILQDRIDLRLLRMQMDELTHRLGLTKATRFISVLDAGPARIRQGARAAPFENGYEFGLEIPLFDSGAARVKRAEAVYAQAVDRFTQAAIDARSDIRVAFATYRASFAIALQQRTVVLPTRQLIAAQDLLRYNASLVSVFDLLADARDQVLSVDAYIQSTRDFWIAKSALDAALPGVATPGVATPGVATPGISTR